MSLRLRRWLARALVFGLAVALFVIVANLVALSVRPFLVVLWLLTLGAFVVASIVDTRLAQRAATRLGAALIAGGAVECRLRYRDLADALGRRWTESVGGRIALSAVLLREDDYATARDVLANVPIESVTAENRPGILSNLALATLEMGDPVQACLLAKQALESAPATDPQRDIILTQLASGYVRSGRYSEAVPLLEDALTREGSAANQARAALLLGQALVALGRTDEARASYERACELAPRGRSAATARERMARLNPYRGD
jgi:tetratricopeptide (TPR) repeat protein